MLLPDLMTETGFLGSGCIIWVFSAEVRVERAGSEDGEIGGVVENVQHDGRDGEIYDQGLHYGSQDGGSERSTRGKFSMSSKGVMVGCRLDSNLLVKS